MTTRFNVRAFDRNFDNPFDEFVRGFFVRPRSSDDVEVPAQIRVDVTENNDGYVVRAEIPGVRKDDIQVSVEGNQVEIGAEVKNEKEIKEGERVLRAERYVGKVYRAFTLAQEVNADAVLAKYADGVLELTLPKKPEAAGKRITVQ